MTSSGAWGAPKHSGRSWWLSPASTASYHPLSPAPAAFPWCGWLISILAGSCRAASSPQPSCLSSCLVWPETICSRQGRVWRKRFSLPCSEPWARGRGAPLSQQCSLQPLCHSPGLHPWLPAWPAAPGLSWACQNPREGCWSCPEPAGTGASPAECQLTPLAISSSPFPAVSAFPKDQNLSC